jgi:hypothetical protein
MFECYNKSLEMIFEVLFKTILLLRNKWNKGFFFHCNWVNVTPRFNLRKRYYENLIFPLEINKIFIFWTIPNLKIFLFEKKTLETMISKCGNNLNITFYDISKLKNILFEEKKY